MPMQRGNRTDEDSLPAAFTLLKSEYSDFLCGSIGEESNHAALTLLSVLSRQGVDPWREAARLNRLPREIARRRLAAIILALPDGRWTKDDAAAIATRLVALLPSRLIPPRHSFARSPAARRRTLSQIGLALVCVGLLAAALFLVGLPPATIVPPTAQSTDTTPR